MYSDYQRLTHAKSDISEFKPEPMRPEIPKIRDVQDFILRIQT